MPNKDGRKLINYITMYNKLSFLPPESLYPVCLSLDDFEDDSTQVVHIQPALTDKKSPFRKNVAIFFAYVKKK
jgi:hypothetical protein